MQLSLTPLHANAAATSTQQNNRTSERRRATRSYLRSYAANARTRRFRVR